jgi:hypothetical protein
MATENVPMSKPMAPVPGAAAGAGGPARKRMALGDISNVVPAAAAVMVDAKKVCCADFVQLAAWCALGRPMPGAR